jgi:ABC-type uncharacterized transport system permease subunit
MSPPARVALAALTKAGDQHADGSRIGGGLPWWRRAVTAILIYVAAFAIALTALAVVVIALGARPGPVIATMAEASIGSSGAVAQTLNRATPLLIGAVAVALALRAGYFNIGIDGQIYAGAISATAVGMVMPDVPVLVGVVAILVMGAIGGALLGSVAAVLRGRWGVNEIFVTVMLNFVAIYFAEYLATGPWNDPVSGEAMTRSVASSVRLPYFLLGGGHIGIFIAIGIAFLVTAVLLNTWKGFEFRSTGFNMVASEWWGVNTARVGVSVLVVSALLGGIAGAIEVGGVHGRLIVGMTPNYGLLAFLVAVVALRSPAAVIPVSFVLAVLIVGTDSLQRSVGLPFAAVLMFQGVVVMSVLVLHALVERYRTVPPSFPWRERVWRVLKLG